MTDTDRTDAHDLRCARELRLRLLVEAGEPAVPSARLLHDIAARINHHCGHNPLKSHRLAWGYTGQEAVDAVHALCAAHGLGARGLALRLWTRWEAGEHPGPDYQDLLCRLFRTRPDRLGFATDYTDALPAVPEFAPTAVTACHNPCDPTPAPPSSVGESVTRTAHEAPTATPFDREPAGGYLDSIERLVTMAADGSAHLGDHPSNVGPLTLDRLRDDAQDLARATTNGQRLVLFDRAVRLRDRVFTLLDGRQRVAESRELYFLGAASLGMLADATQSLGFYGQATTHLRTGLLCAAEAGHPDLTAWLYGMQSLVAYNAGRPGQALDLAQQGQQLPAKGTVRAWLPALAARAAAQRRDDPTARTALEHARQAREQAEADVLDVDYGGILSFSPVKETYYASCSWLALGDGQQTRTSGEAAVRGYQQGPPESRAYDNEAVAQVNIATAHVLDGDLDGANAALAPALRIPPGLRVAALDTALRRLHVHLSRPAYAGAAPATELRDRIEDFLATTPAALPAS